MNNHGFFISAEDLQKLENLFFQFEHFVSTIYEQRIEDDLTDGDIGDPLGESNENPVIC